MKKKNRKYIKYLIISLVIVIYILNLILLDRAMIEDVEVITALGYDMQKLGKDDFIYKLPFSSYIFSGEKDKLTQVKEGKGETIGEAAQDRQNYMNKTYISGLEKVFVISEEYARNGIRAFLDERSRNYATSDRAFGVVYDGDIQNLFKRKVKGYGSMADYLNGLVESNKNSNFFSADYKIIDVIVRADGEGRNVVLPHVTDFEEYVEIDGLAVFQRDKLITVTSLEEARVLNMLRETNSSGIINIGDEEGGFLDVSSVVKRKVKCNKEDDKYNFQIDLKLKCKVVDNTLDKKILNDLNLKKQVEEKINKKVEGMSKEFITKMQNQYKIDTLQLGREAAAKYGRRKDIDWDKVVTNSKIDVKVDAKIENQGRGYY